MVLITALAEIWKLISTLGNSQSFGHNGIDAHSIKSAGGHLIHHLQHLINTSLTKGKFASHWKLSKLTPCLKSQELDRTNVSSCLPIAALPTISKLVERCAQQQLVKFLEETNQLNKSNHAYCQNLSTTMTLMEVMDEIYMSTEEKKMTSVMQIDQSAAFNTVSHPLLIQKLEIYGLGGNSLEWVTNYLKEQNPICYN